MMAGINAALAAIHDNLEAPLRALPSNLSGGVESRHAEAESNDGNRHSESLNGVTGSPSHSELHSGSSAPPAQNSKLYAKELALSTVRKLLPLALRHQAEMSPEYWFHLREQATECERVTNLEEAAAAARSSAEWFDSIEEDATAKLFAKAARSARAAANWTDWPAESVRSSAMTARWVIVKATKYEARALAAECAAEAASKTK